MNHIQKKSKKLLNLTVYLCYNITVKFTGAKMAILPVLQDAPFDSETCMNPEFCSVTMFRTAVRFHRKC